ncbi:hypothetical protein IFM89_020104 [Coptis chinensis]|uniref:Heat shock protein 70 n=1 Tax=Coptis chinensis TaxID=261450 RepID=A0A835LJY2_9MAGN|nr:hypothetical protein IFM89_020104 [Coptis chinensis]
MGLYRIPKVQQLLRDYFDGKEPNKGVNPMNLSLLVFFVQGSILSGEGGEETKGVSQRTAGSLGNCHLSGIAPAPRGTPQIEVTFEVDANGVLNVKAEDKAGGKSVKITITNDKGRLSQEEIDRMTSLNLEKEKIQTAVKEALEWLDENQSAEKDDYDEKLKEVEAVCNPIITAVYQRSGRAVGVGSREGEDEDSHDEL